MSMDSEVTSTNWRKIRAISVARAFSFLGSELTIFALVLREKDAGATTVSTLFILGTLPFILFAPWAGMIADKYSTKSVVLTASLIQAGLVFSLTFDSPHWVIFATLFLANSCGTATNPSWGALIPTLSTKEDLARTFGFSQSTFAVAGLLAPVFAGFLVTTSGFYWPFVLDSISFVVIAFTPILLGVNRSGVVAKPGEKIRALEGIRFIFQEPLLRALVILLSVFILALGVVNVGEVFLVTQELGASALIYGFVGSAFAVGSLLGSTLAALVKIAEHRHVTMVVASLASLSIAVFGIATAWNWIVVFVFSFLAGIGNAGINAYAVAIFMNKSESDFQGRMMAGVSAIINSGGILAMASAGPLIGIFGVRNVLVAGAVLSSLVLLWLAPAVLRESVKIQMKADLASVD